MTNISTGGAVSSATVSYSGGSATTNTSGIYTLRPQDDINSFGVRALRIEYAPGKYYWLETRRAIEDNSSVANGALLYRVNESARECHLLDSTPMSSGGALDATLTYGHTFEDKQAGVYVTPLKSGGNRTETTQVLVNIGRFRVPT